MTLFDQRTIRIETVEYNGRTLSYDGSGKEHILGGEGPILAKHFDVKPGEVFFDVGAADGQWTLYALASGATVYAFEPSMPHYKKLVADVLANDPPLMASADAAGIWQPDFGARGFFERAKLYNIGLGMRDTVERLSDWYGRIVGESASPPEMTPDTLVPVRFLPLDHFLPELERCDWIKVDVEGGEMDVLDGAWRVIEKFRPNLILENHSQIPYLAAYMREHEVVKRIHEFCAEYAYTVTEDTHPQTAGRSFIVATQREAR